LQAHYRSTLDFSNEALQASEKGMQRLFKALENLDTLKSGSTSSFDISTIMNNCYTALNDDMNTPIAIAQLFEGVRYINLMQEGKESLTNDDLTTFKDFMHTVCGDILGLNQENVDEDSDLEDKLMQLIIDLRFEAREKKDYATSDAIRDKLTKIGISLKDGKKGTTWEKS
jgi:cysteinyl-tRNA synthetase